MTIGRGVDTDEGVSILGCDLSGCSCSKDGEGHAAGLGIGIASLILLRSRDSSKGFVGGLFAIARMQMARLILLRMV